MGNYFLLFYTKSKKYFCLLKITTDFFFFTMFPEKDFRNTKKRKGKQEQNRKERENRKKGKERKKEREERKIRDKKAEYGKKKRTPYL
ncbi:MULTISPECIES: hypothetical protein [Bacteroides]|uniref:hypothetical protein n=1 Tax=Bacteroides TaxID=816 RepID=UPI00189DD3AF|nr:MULTISPECIES: hypothetical protein [Bacteroides]MDC2614623.1 hypothetical protein [Bacteroides ovatus]MDC2634234.1 hypothetical protein [Bacteroides ovatus]